MMDRRLILIFVIIFGAIGFTASAGATQHQANQEDIPLNNTTVAIQIAISENGGVITVVRYNASGMSLDEHSKQAMKWISRNVCTEFKCNPHPDPSHPLNGSGSRFGHIFEPSDNISGVYHTEFKYLYNHSFPVGLNITYLEAEEYLLIPHYDSLRIEPPPDTTQRYLSGGGEERPEYSTMAIYRGPRRFNDSEPTIYENTSSQDTPNQSEGNDSPLPGFTALTTLVALAAFVAGAAVCWRQ